MKHNFYYLKPLKLHFKTFRIFKTLLDFIKNKMTAQFDSPNISIKKKNVEYCFHMNQSIRYK